MQIVNFTPVDSLLGGILIGISTTIFLGTTGRICGISGIAKSFMRSEKLENFLWRGAFLGGLILGGFFFIQMKGTSNTAAGFHELNPKLFISAMLVGVGTGYGRGCTSGHGICGIARRSVRSIVATCIFMATAMITVYLTKH